MIFESVGSEFEMGLLNLDYFKCEAFELNFRLYVFGGFWPLKTDVIWKQILYSIFSFLCYLSYTSIVAIQVVDTYILRNDPVGLTRDLCAVSISFTIVIKSILILYKVTVINYLKEKLTEYKNTRTDPLEVEILENSNKEIFKVIKTFYLLAIPCVVFWVIYPMVDSEEIQIPFPYRLPVEEWSYTVYVVVYVYETLATMGFMINTLAVDSMFCGFVLRISAHYDIILKNIRTLGHPRKKNFDKDIYTWVGRDAEAEITKIILRENIELHKKVLKEIQILKKIYGPSCSVHFGGISMIIGTAIIDLVRVAKGFKLQILQKLLFVLAALWDSFLYCFFATKLQQKSLELSWATYEAQWYTMKPEIRRDLMLISLKCQKGSEVKIMSSFQLNLKTFVRILKITYDLTALLFRTMRD